MNSPAKSAAPAPAGATLFSLVAAWVTLCVIWGSTWLVIKIGLTELPPLWFVAIRFVIAATVLFAVCLGRFPLLPRQAADYLFLAGTGLLTFTINYGLLFWGEQHISSGLAAVLQATIPIIGMGFAHLHLPNERLEWPKVLGALLGLTGVAIICAKVLDVPGTLALRGGLAILVGAAACAYSNVWTKWRGGGFVPAVLAAWQMLFGLIPLLALACWEEGSPRSLHWSLLSVACLLYLALVGSALAFLLFYWLLRRVPVNKAQTIALVTPPVAVIIGWQVAGEHVSGWTLLGGGFVLAGLSLIICNIPRRSAPFSPDVPSGDKGLSRLSPLPPGQEPE